MDTAAATQQLVELTITRRQETDSGQRYPIEEQNATDNSNVRKQSGASQFSAGRVRSGWVVVVVEVNDNQRLGSSLGPPYPTTPAGGECS